ncbi:MAG: manganese-binding transcriptional regulator MntR [Bdellovibrionota bacterium]
MNDSQEKGTLSAVPFQAARSQHSREAAEDYTELIAELIETKQEARTCEIAERLGISHVTAIRTLRRLQRDGYVSVQSHRPIELTQKGKRMATYCRQRHRLLVDFLLAVGVPKKAAEMDVEGIEHHISETTLRSIKRFLARAK